VRLQRARNPGPIVISRTGLAPKVEGQEIMPLAVPTRSEKSACCQLPGLAPERSSRGDLRNNREDKSWVEKL
jgi:hypothetical protein